MITCCSCRTRKWSTTLETIPGLETVYIYKAWTTCKILFILLRYKYGGGYNTTQ